MQPTNLQSEYYKEIFKEIFKVIFKVETSTQKKNRVPDGIWTHDPPWSSRML